MDDLDGVIDVLIVVGAVGKAEQANAARDQADSLLSSVAGLRERADEILRRVHTLMGQSGSHGVDAPAVRPEPSPASAGSYRDRHGFLTDGVYRVSTTKNRPHTYETRQPGKSYFNEGTDVEQLSLEAARIADRDNRWRADPGSTYPRRAKVYYDHEVGIHSRTGKPIRVVNVYRKRSGTVHISPGSPQ